MVTRKVLKNESGLWQGIWRASPSPSAFVPLGGRSAGSASYGRGWSHPQGKIGWFNFYWMENGILQLSSSGGEFNLRERDILLMPPGSELFRRDNQSDGAYCWMTMDGVEAASLCATFGLGTNLVMQSGKCPVQLFRQLEESLEDISAGAEFRASSITYEILAGSASGICGETLNPAHSSLIDEAVKRIEKEASNPEFSIKILADELGLHRSRFSRLFSAKTGIPPSDYLRKMRLRLALTALRRSKAPLAKIARECGFNDTAWFCRFFLAEMGMTPSAFRRSL